MTLDKPTFQTKTNIATKSRSIIPDNKSTFIVYAIRRVNTLLLLLLKRKNKRKIMCWSFLYSDYSYCFSQAQSGDAHFCNSNICVSNAK